MKIADQCSLPASPEVVWAALNDPEVLKACLPGCQSLERIDESHFKSTVQVRVGPASATFRSEVTLSDLEPPRRYTMVGQGNAGAAGFAKVVARVELEPAEAGTVLRYDADVEIGGKLMSVGARLIQAASARNLEAFFGAFQAHIESLAAPGGAVAAEVSGGGAAQAAKGSSAPKAAAQPKSSVGMRWPTWLVAAASGSAGLVVGALIGHAV